MTLLELARGWGLAASLAIFVGGIGWRLYPILRRPPTRDLSEPRTAEVAYGAIRGIVRRSWHPATLRRRALTATLFGYALHIGLAIVFFGFVPHIAFVHRVAGIAWPALPGPVFVLGVSLVYLGLGYALLSRLTSPVLRLISSFDDYASWVITALPMLTGMAALTLPLDSAYPLLPGRPLVVALHLLSFELLLVWLPFGKLAHAFLVFASRGTTGIAFARKGAMP